MFAGISENIEVVGTGGAFGCIGDEEAKATAELEVYNTPKRGVANKLLSNDPLLITVVDVRGKAGGSGVLESGQWWIANKTWVANSDAGGNNKSCLIASKMGSLEDGAAGIAVFVDSNPTIIGLEGVTDEEQAYKIFDHSL